MSGTTRLELSDVEGCLQIIQHMPRKDVATNMAHMPTNLVEGTLSGVSPEPSTFSKSENAALTLVLPAQGSLEFGVCVCTCESQPC